MQHLSITHLIPHTGLHIHLYGQCVLYPTHHKVSVEDYLVQCDLKRHQYVEHICEKKNNIRITEKQNKKNTNVDNILELANKVNCHDGLERTNIICEI